MRVDWACPMLLAAALLPGCATREAPSTPAAPLGGIPTNPAPPSCNSLPEPHSGNCVIHLTVADKGSDDCSITLTDERGAELKDLDQIALDVNGARGKFIYWRIISSPGYQFTDDGIAFIDNNRPRMYTQGRKLNDTEYQWRRNQKAARRVNGYVINVFKPASGIERDRECERDPWIRTK